MSERENSEIKAEHAKNTHEECIKKNEKSFEEIIEKNLGDQMQAVSNRLICYLFLNNEPIKNRVKTEYAEHYFMIKDLVKAEKDFMYQTKVRAIWIKNWDYKFCTNN